MMKTTTLESITLDIESEELIRYAKEEFDEEPGRHVIDTLLRYSKSLEVLPSALAGQVEIIKS